MIQTYFCMCLTGKKEDKSACDLFSYSLILKIALHIASMVTELHLGFHKIVYLAKLYKCTLQSICMNKFKKKHIPWRFICTKIY